VCADCLVGPVYIYIYVQELNPTWVCPCHAGLFLQELRSLRRNNVTADQIAVVTPYRRQVRRIKTLLTAKGYGSVQVRTPALDEQAPPAWCQLCRWLLVSGPGTAPRA
jgi:hypothetical protein